MNTEIKTFLTGFISSFPILQVKAIEPNSTVANIILAAVISLGSQLVLKIASKYIDKKMDDQRNKPS